MVDELFDSLVRLRDAAESSNSCAQAIISDYRRRPDFQWAATSAAESEKQRQRERAARKQLRNLKSKAERLDTVADRFYEVTGANEALTLICRAVALRAAPIYVGDLSYPTAHEAAVALGDAVFRAWEYDDSDSDVDPIKVNNDIWKRLRRLAKPHALPPDLYGQIEQEFQAAVDLLDVETPTEVEPPTAKRSIDRDEANLRAREALGNPKLRTIRKLAKAIGCSTGLVGKLPAWTAYQDGLRRKKSPSSPIAVSLTDRVLTTKGQYDPELAKLIGEQRADDEARKKRYRQRRRV